MTDNCYFISSINEISKKEWESCSGQIHPFTSYDFFYALEKSGSSSEETGWKPSHYIQKNSNTFIITSVPYSDFTVGRGRNKILSMEMY